MARPSKRFTLGVALLGLFCVNLAPKWADAFTGGAPDNPLEDAGLTAAAVLSGSQVDSIVTDLYNVLVKKGLVPKLKEARVHAVQNYRSTVFHKLARAWHNVLMYQLRSTRIPQSWSTVAADVHKKLGGKGDFLQALPLLAKRGKEFNMRSGPLREEFLSYAVFFLNAFVPKEIEKCGSQDDQTAVFCIAEYEQQLQAALISTLTSFFEYIVARAPASRILTISFVFAAVSPCPFGYLIEPVFVYGVLVGSQSDLLKSLASIRRVSSAKACPEFKKTLLRVLMAVGVTPGDIMKTKKLSKEFNNFSSSSKMAVKAASGEVSEAASIDKKSLLKKDGTAAGPSLDTASEILAELGTYLGAMFAGGRDKFFSSSVGENAQKSVEADDSADGRGYLDRLRTILEDGDPGKFEPLALKLEDLIKEVSDAIAAEASANPQRTPFKAIEGGSVEEQAKHALEQTRSFSLRTEKFLQPKEENEGKEDKE